MIPALPDGTVRLGGLELRDHTVEVPLDHAAPDGERIHVFAREVSAAGRDVSALPWLLYLQGGPGSAADRPAGATDGWIGRAVKDFRVLLLDQRGTGRSSPITPSLLAARGSTAAQADWLALHRADSIVGDAELVREQVVGPGTSWALLGQSFGGFCAFTYLSRFAGSLDAVCVTGGIPALHADADEVYRAAYPRMRAKNAAYFAAFPADRGRVDHLVALARAGTTLPDGSPLTVERVQHLGIALGSRRRTAALHWLLDQVDPGGEPSPALLAALAAELSFVQHPLYALLHEACYAQGAATGWAAERVRAEHPDFAPDADPVLLTGETVHPWMFDVDPALRPYRDVAQALAERAGWPRLYDLDALARNTVSVAAAVSTRTTCTWTRGCRWRLRPTSGACAPGRPTPTSTTACARRRTCWTGCCA